MTDPKYTSSPFGQNNSNGSTPSENPYEPAQYPVHDNSDKKRLIAGGPVMSSRRVARMKKSEIKRNILIIISVILGLLLALVATDTLKLGTGPQPYFENEAALQSASQPAEVAGIEEVKLRTPTAQDPLRVYIGGDSLAGSYGFNLATHLGKTGLIDPVYDSRPSSGLSSPDFFDWELHVKDVISVYNPELLFLSLGTNDASIVSSNPDNYVEEYSELVENIIDLVDTNERSLYFVLAPSMKDQKLNTNLIELNDIIRKTASANNSNVIHMGESLSPNNNFVESIIIESKRKVIRSNDGIHITGQGGSLVSEQIYKEVKNIVDLSSSDPTNPIPPTKARGWGSTISRNSNPNTTATVVQSTRDATTSPASTTSTTTSQTTSPISSEPNNEPEGDAEDEPEI